MRQSACACIVHVLVHSLCVCVPIILFVSGRPELPTLSFRDGHDPILLLAAATHDTCLCRMGIFLADITLFTQINVTWSMICSRCLTKRWVHSGCFVLLANRWPLVAVCLTEKAHEQTFHESDGRCVACCSRCSRRPGRGDQQYPSGTGTGRGLVAHWPVQFDEAILRGGYSDESPHGLARPTQAVEASDNSLQAIDLSGALQVHCQASGGRIKEHAERDGVKRRLQEEAKFG